MSQTLTLIARGHCFEYAPSAIHLEKHKSIKTESTNIKDRKIKLIYRGNTFEYTPQPSSVLSYYRNENRPINWRFKISAKTEKFDFSVLFNSLLNWKSN
jgi:hypothetical protein